MRKPTIEQEAVKQLIDDGVIELLDKKYCETFDDYVCKYIPWDEYAGDRIDWEKYAPTKQIDIGSISASHEKIYRFLKKLVLVNMMK